jgi:large subunit ribosomal protein L30
VSAASPWRRWEDKMSNLLIRQVKSGLGAPHDQRATLKALGLRHQRSVVQQDNPAIRGMIFKVRHLVEVTEVEGQE